MKKQFYLAAALLLTYGAAANARETEGLKHKNTTNQRVQGGCVNPVGRVDIDLANVRAMILTGGDMWWDEPKGNAQYEVPKQAVADSAKRRTSMFAGELWLGGYDQYSQLHLAGQTYRQAGNDFWPGPLDTVDASISANECVKYDKIWKLDRRDVAAFAKNGGGATADMLSWPGNGDASQGQSHYLAPFIDKGGDGIYNPAKGDYPALDVSGNTYSLCDAKKLPGDQVLWWVVNDNGNVHTESGGAAIGVEIQATAFVINDTNSAALQNSTFYGYKIINRGSFSLSNTYFGVFADPDLGYYGDDYVGCDVNLGLGYCYNGLPLDRGNSQGYNDAPFDGTIPPPAIGIDFLEGPFVDANGKDDPKSADSTRSGTGYGDGIIDNERIGMAKFVYFTNGGASPQGDPANAQQFYNYLIGKWQDGRPLTYGGTGLGGATPVNWMFSGTSDTTLNNRSDWSEKTNNDAPGDRRFLISAGRFTLKPGAVNYIAYAVIWARGQKGGTVDSSVAALKRADVEIQALFNACVVAVGAAGVVKNNAPNIAVSVFPNPFTTQTQVYIDAALISKPVTLKVYDITGKCVRQYDNVTAGYLSIQRGDLKSGLYLYRIENNNSALAQGKVVVE